MSRRYLVSAVLALALLVGHTIAEAKVVFFSSFELGPQGEPTPIDFSFWATQPTPTAAATPQWPRVTTVPSPLPVPAGIVDRYGLRFQGVSGGDGYRLLQQNINGPVAQLALTFGGLYITDPGPAGTVCDLGWLGTAAARGLQASFTSHGAGQDVTLNVYTTDSTTTRCFGSNVDGRRCTADEDISDDCPSTNPVETTCIVPIFASVNVPLQSYRNVQIQQINGSGATAGRLTGNLWEGPMGSAYSRAGSTITVGECDTTYNPCNVNADCATPDTYCSLANVIGITTAGIAKKDTGTCAADWFVSFIALQDDTVPSANLYSAALDPAPIPTPDTNWDNQGSAHSCGANNRPACLDDAANGGPDADSSDLRNSAAAKPTVAINLVDPATPTAAASPIAITLEAAVQDAASGTGVELQLRPEVNGTQSPCPTPTPRAVDDLAGSGSTSDPYYLWSPMVCARDYTTAEINSLTAVLNKAAASGSQSVRVTALEGSVLYRTADPVVPTVLPDRDQDGQDTVCWATNSRGHASNSTYRATVKAGLLEPTNLYWYSRGGANQGDLNAQFTSLVEGASGGFIPLDVQRGTSGKTCDVLLAAMSANNLNPGNVADPQLGSVYSGLGQQGYCEDEGGADQGGPCICPNGIGNETSMYGATPAPQITPAARYCVNAGDFGDTCKDVSGTKAVGCDCATNADCRRGGFATDGICTSGTCTAGSYLLNADAAANVRTSVCEPGCLDGLGCSGGVCVAHHTLARNLRYTDDLLAAVALRPTPAATPPLGGKPIIVHEIDPPGTGLGGWGSSMHPMASAVRAKIRAKAVANGWAFIDLWARFRQRGDPYAPCCAGTVAGCTGACTARGLFRDFPHYNDAGQTVHAEIEVECLTNALPGEAAGTRTHDGICTANVCTSGLVGDPCTSGTVLADCATWHCDFGAQP